MTSPGNHNIRPITLTAASAGMSRMRTRGGASPETLYDLNNGYISPAKAPTQRPGTSLKFTLPAHTKGLCSFNGTMHVFTSGNDANTNSYILPAPGVSVANASGGSLIVGANSYRVSAVGFWGEGIVSDAVVVNSAAGSKNTISWTVVPGALQYNVYGRTPNNELQMQVVAGLSFIDAGAGTPAGPAPAPLPFVIDILRHPDPAFTGHIKAIHFSAPFLGYLYVVAEFDDGQVFHYWLRRPETWLGSHEYHDGDIAQPSTPNGYYYTAAPKQVPNAWAPSVKRAVGDVVQPTTANGFKYTVTTVAGGNPASGTTEPTWPKLNTATVREFVESDGTAPPPAAPPSPAPSPPDGYTNPGGTAPPRLPVGGGAGRTPILQN